MKKIKMIIDILLLIVTVILVDIDVSGRLIHEILGIVMALLIIIHITLNFDWIKQVTKNFKKVNAKSKIMYLIDILTMIIYLGAIIFGIIISNELFKFKTASNAKFILTHIIFGKLAITIMLIHVGTHLNRMLYKIKFKSVKKAIYVIYTIITLIISTISLHTLFNSFWWMMVYGNTF